MMAVMADGSYFKLKMKSNKKVFNYIYLYN